MPFVSGVSKGLKESALSERKNQWDQQPKHQESERLQCYQNQASSAMEGAVISF